MLIKEPSKLDMVREFHRAFGATSPTTVEEFTALCALRAALISEESRETIEALIGIGSVVKLEAAAHVIKRRKAELLKELCDLLYVVYGTADRLELNIDAAFAAVHLNNMSKLGPDGKPIVRADGKFMKPEGYQPVDLSHLV
jgi:predicted HAD superfamily Cof-like phosphohydrolase